MDNNKYPKFVDQDLRTLERNWCYKLMSNEFKWCYINNIMNKFALPILITRYLKIAKGCLVAELAPPHTQNVLGFRGEMIRTVRLAACCNYL